MGAPVPREDHVQRREDLGLMGRFRVKQKDGSFELVEVKGFETDVYKPKKKLLENMLLPEHPDHTYLVVK